MLSTVRWNDVNGSVFSSVFVRILFIQIGKERKVKMNFVHRIESLI